MYLGKIGPKTKKKDRVPFATTVPIKFDNIIRRQALNERIQLSEMLERYQAA